LREIRDKMPALAQPMFPPGQDACLTHRPPLSAVGATDLTAAAGWEHFAETGV